MVIPLLLVGRRSVRARRRTAAGPLSGLLREWRSAGGHLVAAAGPLIGLALFSGYAAVHAGDWLAPLHAEGYWGRGIPICCGWA